MKTSPLFFTEVSGPVGKLTLLASERGITGVRMEKHPSNSQLSSYGLRDDNNRFLAAASVQLAEYFVGNRQNFDLDLDLEGTPFQLRAWQVLREIPYGETISYGEQARRIGVPGASRAAGLANNRNPLPIIIPCHRVVGVKGALVGFGGGLDRKRFLLDLEQRHTPFSLV
ncbi:MAG TPA: methylated-DNA--[protein]-cysteine S-methyltransferase [Chthoniobacterales bacterium]